MKLGKRGNKKLFNGYLSVVSTNDEDKHDLMEVRGTSLITKELCRESCGSSQSNCTQTPFSPPNMNGFSSPLKFICGCKFDTRAFNHRCYIDIGEIRNVRI